MTDLVNKPPHFENVIDKSIDIAMKEAYMQYSMSVIKSRALPDLRDGLKPVHRRVLYVLKDYGKFTKSARIVGETMSNYHPHGDSAIYDTTVRLAQTFSMGAPLIEGQGNFGSIDGDSAAAMRYTEVRLEAITQHLLNDLHKDIIDFTDNYDGSTKEPTVLSAEFPNLLVNGSSGVAVGMATNIPPYNLIEVINATIKCIDKPGITAEELLKIICVPDFPTGGSVIGLSGSISAMKTGRGSVIMRGEANIKTVKNKSSIIITELPYQVNKAKMVEKIAELVKAKSLVGISDIRDESDKQGIRVVIEIKRDSDPEMVLNNLYLKTSLQTTFSINLLALDESMPKLMSIKTIIEKFLKFRELIVTRRINCYLKRASDRLSRAITLFIAISNIDEVVGIIRSADSKESAINSICSLRWEIEDRILKIVSPVSSYLDTEISKSISLTTQQAEIILEIKLYKITKMEADKVAIDIENIANEIKEYAEILSSKAKLYDIIKSELINVKNKFGKPRMTKIIHSDEIMKKTDIDFINKEEIIVIMTYKGYIKRVTLDSYRTQNRGGKGKSGFDLQDDDIITNIFVGNTHNRVLFFTTSGMVYQMMAYEVPSGSPTSRGRSIVNFIKFKEGEKITSIIMMDNTTNKQEMIFVTAKGVVRKNSAADFENIKSNGKIAIKINEDDTLIKVLMCEQEDHVLLSTYMGKSIRFQSSSLRLFKMRTSGGVRGMQLGKNDKIVSASIIPNNKIDSSCVLTITENGCGKRTHVKEYRITNRGGRGIQNISISKKNGKAIASIITDTNTDNEIMLITNKGQIIRVPIASISIIGRSTQGVKIFNVVEDEKVTSVVQVAQSKNIIADDEEESASTDTSDGQFQD